MGYFLPFFPKKSAWGERAEVGGEVGHVVPYGVVDLMESKDLLEHSSKGW